MYYRKTLCAQQENVDQYLTDNGPFKNRQPPWWKMHWSIPYFYTGDSTVSLKKSARILPANISCPSIKNASSGIQPECFRVSAAPMQNIPRSKPRIFTRRKSQAQRESCLGGSGQTACPSESQARHCFGKQNCHSSPYTFL